MSITFTTITEPFWLEELEMKNPTTFSISAHEAVSHFGCRRYVLSCSSDSVKERILEREVYPFAYLLKGSASDTRLHELVEIVKGFFHHRTGNPIDGVRVITDALGGTAFLPLVGEEFVYVPPSYTGILGLDLDQIEPGLSFYSGSDLAWPLISTTGLEIVQHHSGIILARDPPEDAAEEVSQYVTAKWEAGVIALRQQRQFTTKIRLAKELCRLWDCEPSSTVALSPLVEVGIFSAAPEMGLGCDFKSWLCKALLDIVLGRVPVFRFTPHSHPPSTSRMEVAGVTPFPDGSIAIEAYSRRDLERKLEQYMNPDPRAEVGIEPTDDPLLIGQVGYDDSEWYVDLGVIGRQTLAVFDTDTPEEYLDSLQLGWVQGRYATKWGRYLYTNYRRASVLLVKPWNLYRTSEEFWNFIG